MTHKRDIFTQTQRDAGWFCLTAGGNYFLCLVLKLSSYLVDRRRAGWRGLVRDALAAAALEGLYFR